MRLLPQTIRGEFALFATSLALPFVLLIGYGLYDRTRDDIAASEAIARRPLVRAMDAARCDPRLADIGTSLLTAI